MIAAPAGGSGARGWRPAAVFFDLDGTLVETTADFYRGYFLLLAQEFGGDRGAELVAAVNAATEEVRAEGFRPAPVGERMLRGIARRLGLRFEDVASFFERFYATRYDGLAGTVRAIPGARRLVEAARGLGAFLGLASDPVFPRETILKRLAWGGLDPAAFALVLGAEEAHALKPTPDYFLELARLARVAPEACALVGNDPDLDGAAAAVGMRVFVLAGDAHAVTHREVQGPPKFEGARTGSVDDAVAWLAAFQRGE